MREEITFENHMIFGIEKDPIKRLRIILEETLCQRKSC